MPEPTFIPSALLPALMLIHAGASSAMAGLVWLVQLVHYPLMSRIPAADFPAYEHAHQRRITPLVATLMFAEAASAVLIYLSWPGPGSALPILSILLLAVVWISTFLIQVPLHARLAAGFDAQVHRRLIRTNWLRTVGWTARAIVALAMIWPFLRTDPP